MATVRIPPTLRAEVGGVRELDAHGSTVADVIDDLVERFPALEAQLLQRRRARRLRERLRRAARTSARATGSTPRCATATS